MLAQKLCKMTLVDEGCCVYKGLDVGMYSGGGTGPGSRLELQTIYWFSQSWRRPLLALSHIRHYAKRALTPRSLNVKLGPRRNYHKGRAAIRHYAKQPARPL